MGESSKSEGVLIDVAGLLCFDEHVGDEVSAADVVGEIAEEMGAEGVVADVLNEAAAISIGVGLTHPVVGSTGKASEKSGADLGFPEEINDLLVGQDGVSWRTLTRHEETEQDAQTEQVKP